MIKYSQNLSRHVRVTVGANSLQMARQTKVNTIMPSMTIRGIKITNQLPSETTTVLLRRLPLTATQESLQSAVESVKCRKVEIEPGCLIHATNYAEASFIQSKLASSLGLTGHIASSALPALVLDNLPTNITVEELRKTFGNYNLKGVRVIGKQSVQVKINGVEAALAAARVLEATSAGIDVNATQKLSLHVVYVNDDTFVLNVTNFAESVSSGADAERLVKVALSNTQNDLVVAAAASVKTDISPASFPTAEIRLSSALSEQEVTDVRNQLGAHDFVHKTAAIERRNKPCLLFRKVPGARKGAVQTLLKTHGCADDVVRILINERGKPHEIGADVTAVYFKSREAALKALQTLHGKQGYTSSIYVKYVEQCEPSVLVTGLPDEFYSEEALMKLFHDCKPA